MLCAALLITFASAEVKYYNNTGATIANYAQITSSSIFFEYSKDKVYRSLHGTQVKLLNDSVLKNETGEVLEVAQCTAAECYMAVIKATDLVSQEITVS